MTLCRDLLDNTSSWMHLAPLSIWWLFLEISGCFPRGSKVGVYTMRVLHESVEVKHPWEILREKSPGSHALRLPRNSATHPVFQPNSSNYQHYCPVWVFLFPFLQYVSNLRLARIRGMHAQGTKHSLSFLSRFQHLPPNWEIHRI